MKQTVRSPYERRVVGYKHWLINDRKKRVRTAAISLLTLLHCVLHITHQSIHRKQWGLLSITRPTGITAARTTYTTESRRSTRNKHFGPRHHQSPSRHGSTRRPLLNRGFDGCMVPKWGMVAIKQTRSSKPWVSHEYSVHYRPCNHQTICEWN